MRIETRGPGGIYGRRRLVLIICEDEDDNALYDAIGDLGDKFSAELKLADGYAEAYIQLEKTPAAVEAATESLEAAVIDAARQLRESELAPNLGADCDEAVVVAITELDRQLERWKKRKLPGASV